MGKNHKNVQQSNAKGFTPMGEKHLLPSDVSGLIPCQLTGKDLLRPAVLYIHQAVMAKKVAKYARLGCYLAIPESLKSVLAEQMAELELDLAIEAATRKDEQDLLPAGKKNRYVVCLNTGHVFPHPLAVAKKYKMSTDLVNVHLRGGCASAKGRRFRHATPDEVGELTYNPDWTYPGELLPILPAGNKKA